MIINNHVLIESIESDCLKNNPVHDPYIRKVPIFLPPDYENSNQKYPVLFFLPGFTGKGITLLNRDSFSESFDDKLYRLMNSKIIKPMIVVMPDCFTYYGCSQYIDSAATGKYKTHIVNELVPYIKQKFRVIDDPAAWAIAGKSSGGYGAVILAMSHPDIFNIVACHSGDMGFEYSYIPDFPPAMIELEKSGGIVKFMHKFNSLPKKDAISMLTLEVIAYSAAYSPNIENKPHFIDLPFCLKTGEIQQSVWNKWLSWDPIHMIDIYKQSLDKMKFFIDCGIYDEFRLYVGSRIFSAKLRQLGIKHCYEEFEDDHMNITYRYDRSLKFISDNLP